jgi:hypothetical protein
MGSLMAAGWEGALPTALVYSASLRNAPLSFPLSRHLFALNSPDSAR